MKTIINYTKNFKMYLVFIFIILISCDKVNEIVPIPYAEGTVRIAKWKGDKKAAILLQFDDSTPGQATLGIPAMNKRNIVGTWYVNPGREAFIKYNDYWTINAATGGQELANHTMNHSGASTYEEVVYEVGEASKIIWDIRKEEDFGSLIAFNRGGGTSWNESDLAKVLDNFKNIDRQSKIGIKISALSVPAGSNANKMYEIIPNVLNDSIIGSIHFHGIAAENGNPPMDWGNAAVWINEFEGFLDKLVSINDAAWICGFTQVYKYTKERETAKVSLNQYSEDRLSIDLSSEMDENYYNEPLTILVYLPKEWEKCLIEHNGTENNYTFQNGVLMFDAIPNKGEILLTKK